MDFAPQLQIRRTLTLVRAIGQGGMATVWLADDLARGCRVAVKLLRPELNGNLEAMDRFRSEADALIRMRSPYVPCVYEKGTLSDGTPFIEMEWMEGVDLDRYFQTHGRLSLRTTARLVSQVAAALDGAHRIGIIHRDVKPENLFVRGEGEDIEVRLFDFGIAMIPDARRTQVSTQMGTPSYMSPEQLVSLCNVDHRTDLWSLGVVTYLALTGKLPFDGETFGAVCLAIHHGVYDLVSELVPGTPVEVDTWMGRALHPNLDSRFRTAHELQASFAAIAFGGSRQGFVPGLAPVVVSNDDATPPFLLSGTSSTRHGTLRRSRRGLLALPALAMASALGLYSTLENAAPGWLPAEARTTWVRVGQMTASATGFDWASSPPTQCEVTSASMPAEELTILRATTSTSEVPELAPADGEEPAVPSHAGGTAESDARPVRARNATLPSSQAPPQSPTPPPVDTDQVIQVWPPPGTMPKGFGNKRD
jgi:eukaryotic-like serine/threonine-protein kinase